MGKKSVVKVDTIGGLDIYMDLGDIESDVGTEPEKEGETSKPPVSSSSLRTGDINRLVLGGEEER